MPAVCRSEGARKASLDRSLFERLASGASPYHYCMLTHQMCMHPDIAELASQVFYEGRLSSGVSRDDRAHPQPGQPPWISDSHLIFWRVLGAEEEPRGLGIRNVHEADAVHALVTQLNRNSIVFLRIAVLTPYRGQLPVLQSRLSAEVQQGLDVATVDSYQGREADYIIVSLVRSNNKRSVGFLADARRANVALTRGRRGVIIVGNDRCVVHSAPWCSVLRWMERSSLGATGDPSAPTAIELCTEATAGAPPPSPPPSPGDDDASGGVPPPTPPTEERVRPPSLARVVSAARLYTTRLGETINMALISRSQERAQREGPPPVSTPQRPFPRRHAIPPPRTGGVGGDRPPPARPPPSPSTSPPAPMVMWELQPEPSAARPPSQSGLGVFSSLSRMLGSWASECFARSPELSPPPSPPAEMTGSARPGSPVRVFAAPIVPPPPEAEWTPPLTRGCLSDAARRLTENGISPIFGPALLQVVGIYKSPESPVLPARRTQALFETRQGHICVVLSDGDSKAWAGMDEELEDTWLRGDIRLSVGDSVSVQAYAIGSHLQKGWLYVYNRAGPLG